MKIYKNKVSYDFLIYMLRSIKNMVGNFLGYSGCLNCGDSWWYKEEHIIEYKNRGWFPFCKECWSKLNDYEKQCWYNIGLAKINNESIQK